MFLKNGADPSATEISDKTAIDFSGSKNGSLDCHVLTLQELTHGSTELLNVHKDGKIGLVVWTDPCAGSEPKTV